MYLYTPVKRAMGSIMSRMGHIAKFSQNAGVGLLDCECGLIQNHSVHALYYFMITVIIQVKVQLFKLYLLIFLIT